MAGTSDDELWITMTSDDPYGEIEYVEEWLEARGVRRFRTGYDVATPGQIYLSLSRRYEVEITLLHMFHNIVDVRRTGQSER